MGAPGCGIIIPGITPAAAGNAACGITLGSSAGWDWAAGTGRGAFFLNGTNALAVARSWKGFAVALSDDLKPELFAASGFDAAGAAFPSALPKQLGSSFRTDYAW